MTTKSGIGTPLPLITEEEQSLNEEYTELNKDKQKSEDNELTDLIDSYDSLKNESIIGAIVATSVMNLGISTNSPYLATLGGGFVLMFIYGILHAGNQQKDLKRYL